MNVPKTHTSVYLTIQIDEMISVLTQSRLKREVLRLKSKKQNAYFNPTPAIWQCENTSESLRRFALCACGSKKIRQIDSQKGKSDTDIHTHKLKCWRMKTKTNKLENHIGISKKSTAVAWTLKTFMHPMLAVAVEIYHFT